MIVPVVTIQFPEWVQRFLDRSAEVFAGREERMRFAMELARLNVRHGSGGPFGAAVFGHDGTLIAPGINMVVSSGCSLLHAEMVALAAAQKVLGRHDIGDGGRLRYDLYATSEPCAMCFGAIPWSGVSGLVCGVRETDARAIGFDEGTKPADWVAALNERGIGVERDVLRPEAIAVLQEYMAAGGVIYGPGTRTNPPAR